MELDSGPAVHLLRGSMVRLRPLLLGFWVAFLVGLGGTTPVGHLLLGRAFDVLTMERFSYWATLLALPFVGLLATELVDRYRNAAVAVGLTTLAACSCALGSGVGNLSARGCRDFKVDSVRLVAQSRRSRSVSLRHSGIRQQDRAAGHDDRRQQRRWRMEFRPHAAGVDSAIGAGALTSSKYFGEPGLDALRRNAPHADHYGLKWVFLRDHYYDPLLVFAGWRPVDSLEDKTITVWSKDGRTAGHTRQRAPNSSRWQGLMWGILPIRQQPSGDVPCAFDSGEATARRRASNRRPPTKISCIGRLIS
jgi:hypothetical protein